MDTTIQLPDGKSVTVSHEKELTDDDIRNVAKEMGYDVGGSTWRDIAGEGTRIAGAIGGAIRGSKQGPTGAAIGGLLGALAAEPVASAITPREETMGEHVANVALGLLQPEAEAGTLIQRLLRGAKIGTLASVGHRGIETLVNEERLPTSGELQVPAATGAVVGGGLEGLLGPRLNNLAPEQAQADKAAAQVPQPEPTKEGPITASLDKPKASSLEEANAQANEIISPSPEPPVQPTKIPEPPTSGGKRVSIEDEDSIDAEALAQTEGDGSVKKPEAKVIEPDAADEALAIAKTKPVEEWKADRARYEELQAQMTEPSVKKDADKLKEVWGESEKIKNKYGGMPPPEVNSAPIKAEPLPAAAPPLSVPESPVKSSGLAESVVSDADSKVGVRKPIQRVLESDQVPAEFKNEYKNNPEILYDVQNQREWVDRAKATPTEELLPAVEEAKLPGQKVVLLDEYRNRMIEQKNHAEAMRADVESAKLKTPGGQLLAASKLIRNPLLALAQAEEQVAKVGKGLSEEARQKIVDLSSKEIKAKDALVLAERKAKENFTKENVEAYRSALKDHAEASFDLDEYQHAIAPRHWDDMISNFIRGNLQTLLSPLSGFLGNITFRPITRSAESIASLMDAALVKGTHAAMGDAILSRRSLMKSNPFGNPVELEAFANGVKLGAKEILKGPTADSAIMGEIHRGFRPLRSLVEGLSGENLPLNAKGKVDFEERMKAFTEATLGVAPETLFRIISLSDKPFRYEGYTRELINQANLYKDKLRFAAEAEMADLGRPGPAAQALKNFNQDKFMEFPPPHADEAAKRAAGYVTFSSKNPLSNVLNKLLGGDYAEHIPILRSTIKVLGAMIVPFRQFPINYAMTALNFAAPNFGLAKAGYYVYQSRKLLADATIDSATKANQALELRRKGLTTLGESIVGMTMYAAASILWDKGLISENVGKDNAERSRQAEQMGYQQLNISGLKRYLEGGDPTYRSGDTKVDWSRMGIPAAVFAIHTDQMMSDIRRQWKEGKDTAQQKPPSSSPMDDLNKSISAIPALGSFVFNQSFLSGTNAFLEAMKDADPSSSAWQNATQNLFRAATGIVIPAETEAIARARMEYIPELRGKDTMDTLKNIFNFKLNQLPKDDQSIAFKRDIWGNPVKRTPDGANPYVYNLVDVMKTNAKEFDPVDADLMKLYKETLRPSVYPDPVNRDIVSPNGDGYRLDPKDYEKLQEVVGKYRRQAVEQFVNDKGFYDKFQPDEKVLALERLYSEANKMGREEFINSSDIYRRYFAPDSGRKPDSRTTESLVKEEPGFGKVPGPAK